MFRNNTPLELLVVEDNPGDILLLKEYLQLSQLPIKEILEAETIADIPTVLDSKEIDLAFLDLSLPDSEGIYSFTYLNDKLPHTPIIILTGLSDINVALEALSLGAQDYVMKSDFNEKLLTKSIRYSIERKRSEEKMQHMNEELRDLSAHLLNVREEERTRIAREIHDQLGQQITGLKMDVSWAKKKLIGVKNTEEVQNKLKDVTSLLDETVKTIRKIASDLRPSLLDDIGLIAALDWQSIEFKTRFGVDVIFNAPDDEINIEPDIATGLFRIYQETLTNVARHANATKVITTFDAADKNITLSIEDNGKGFNVTNIGQRKTLGLLGMKERIAIIGGNLEIQSKPGKGTKVIVTVNNPA